MGKKIDLNKPKKTNITKNQKNHSYRQYNNTIPNDNNSEQSNSPNNIQKKGAEIGLRAAGVPKGLAKTLANDNRTYQLADKVNATIKMPLPLKIMVPVILVLIPFIGLMVFVVLFADTSSSSYGNFAYGQTCTTVTVTDTGCNGKAQNCSHIYDGDVSFEDYVAGVVAAEVGSANNLEYYKVTAIAARTFFLDNVDSSCTVKGNATYQAYMDVEDSSNAELIKKAVEETEGLILVKNGELVSTYYASACVVDADDEYYYVRYGTESLGEAKFQKIPKEWDDDPSHAFNGYLRSWYSEVDQNDTNLETKSCPNNHDYAMSQLGALYLITGENYDYESVLKYYYGEDAEVMVNDMQLNGVDGFVNPTRYIHCSSAFGYRMHPIKQERLLHKGLDIGIPGGEPIYAVKDGTVRLLVDNVSAINNCTFGYGNYIYIDHGDGLSTLYAHIKYGTIPSSIYVGATVSQGEQIGEVGSTGCSTGDHLHYEVRQNNNPIEPADYLDLTGATGSCRR